MIVCYQCQTMDGERFNPPMDISKHCIIFLIITVCLLCVHSRIRVCWICFPLDLIPQISVLHWNLFDALFLYLETLNSKISKKNVEEQSIISLLRTLGMAVSEKTNCV